MTRWRQKIQSTSYIPRYRGPTIRMGGFIYEGYLKSTSVLATREYVSRVGTVRCDAADVHTWIHVFTRYMKRGTDLESTFCSYAGHKSIWIASWDLFIQIGHSLKSTREVPDSLWTVNPKTFVRESREALICVMMTMSCQIEVIMSIALLLELSCSNGLRYTPSVEESARTDLRMQHWTYHAPGPHSRTFAWSS